MNKEKLNAIAKKRWVPKGYVQLERKNGTGDLLFYSTELKRNDKSLGYAAIAYTEKSFNHLWHYSFKTYDQMVERIKKTIDDRLQQQASVKDRRVKRLEPHTLKVGDILYTSWGYDQTNIEFFQVDELVGKNKLKLVGLGTKTLSGDGFSDKVVPGDRGGNHWTTVKGKVKDVAMTKVARSDNTVRMSSFCSAYKWDGQAKYQTDSRAGH